MTLQMKGDWGQGNLHRICGWLAQELGDRAPEGTKTAIWTGRGGADAVAALRDREVDIAILVPAAFGPMARHGIGLFDGLPMPELRALGTMPQTDRLVLALAGEHGISTFKELRARQPALRIATGPDDGINPVGWAARAVLKAHGITANDIEQWGGQFVIAERPFQLLDYVIEGSADAILFEAVMEPLWHEATRLRDLVFLPMEDAALASLEAQYAWPPAVVQKGWFPGLEQDLPTAEFSDFIVLAREDLDADVAGLLAWAMVETRANLERFYRHIPAEQSPVTWPLVPTKIAQTSIPLHPGAAAQYERLGVMPQ